METGKLDIGRNSQTAEVPMESNPELELAWQLVEYTGVNVFLTGKAGSGKTTFLRSLRERSTKRMVVLAPTGVAAMNAGGVTIHSFFQLPFAPFVPESHFGGEAKYQYVLVRRRSTSCVVSICWSLMKSAWCALTCSTPWTTSCAATATVISPLAVSSCS